MASSSNPRKMKEDEDEKLAFGGATLNGVEPGLIEDKKSRTRSHGTSVQLPPDE
jgi:hypothetical protein